MRKNRPSIVSIILIFLGVVCFNNAKTANTPYRIAYSNEVHELMNTMNPQSMWNNLTVLSHFPDRYSNSDNGTKTMDWVKQQIEEMIKITGRNDITFYSIPTGKKYKQSSLVVKIGKSELAGVVIGAHLDTLSSQKPGADDDGSGTVTLLELARSICVSGMEFKKPIYLIWYAAEEEDPLEKNEGLLGSKYVVKYFTKNHIPVAAVLQLDMTGYLYQNDPAIWLNDDYVNKKLNNYLEKLIIFYVNTPVKHSLCGTPCSDHYRWFVKGYPTVFPFEAAAENPYMHTENDTIDKLSLTHMTDFLKLTIAFTVELAEPIDVTMK